MAVTSVNAQTPQVPTATTPSAPALGSATPAAVPAPVPAKPKLSPLAVAPDWSQLSHFSGVLSKEEFDQAITKIYSNLSNFPLPWKTEPTALLMNTSPGVAPVRIEFRHPGAPEKVVPKYWRTPAELAPLQPDEPVLKGVHIALDPGHIGGIYAKIEERWLSMNPGEQVMEGTLVLQIAALLKPRLEALGANVSMVRQKETPVTMAKPEDFRPLAKQILLEAGITNPVENYTDPRDEARILSVQWQAEKLFYRVSEIRARADKVNNDLKPDVVLCLHLNAEAWGDPQKPVLVNTNHFHLLINGCYSPDELQSEDVRMEMLQRLFGRVHEQELAMADTVSAAMMRTTGLPPFVYLNNNARRVSPDPGVFARNLLASRLYQCPVLYFEPYVMNDALTYKRLLLPYYVGRTLVDGQLLNSPLEDYTRGVVAGLVEYYKKARTQAN